ncbi:Pol polyprotein [Gossypium australe]|uniref:Pol polyprotein n=1 Tax=Gossypium australe TaxID=47621 RepID=A0A5B6WER6_9ROSI|nr:Pol polyprotein [Gossypium australe]
MVYGVEEIILAGIAMRSHRTTHFNENIDQEAMKLNLDLIDEVREVAKIRNVTCVQQVAYYYNSNVKNKNIKTNLPALQQRKMALRWEGPYRVVEKISYEAYKLARLVGTTLPHT